MPLDLQLDGQPLPEVNFVHVDQAGRLWIAVSSGGASDPVFRLNADEGRVLLADENGLRVVASGLGWTNEVKVARSGDRLFINETFGRRLVSFAIAEDGSLGDRQVVATFGIGDYPDGLAFDDAGAIWVISIISNRVLRITDEGTAIIFEDSRPEMVAALEARLVSQGLTRGDLHGLVTGTVVNNISSLAFAGEDRRTVVLGSLGSDCLWAFDIDFAGHTPGLVMPRFLTEPSSLLT